MSRKVKPIPPAVAEFFRYDPDTGFLYWAKDRRRARAGTRITGKTTKNRLRVMLDGQEYLVHRIAWYLHTGEQPADVLDHRDGDPTNNKWTNLRAATDAMNQWNKPINPISRSGVKGVTWRARIRKWRCTISKDGATYTKQFKEDQIEEATAWIRAKRLELHGEFAQF